MCLSACHAVSIKHLDVGPDVLCALMTSCMLQTSCLDRCAVLLSKGATCAVLAGVGVFNQEGDDFGNVDGQTGQDSDFFWAWSTSRHPED